MMFIGIKPDGFYWRIFTCRNAYHFTLYWEGLQEGRQALSVDVPPAQDANHSACLRQA